MGEGISSETEGSQSDKCAAGAASRPGQQSSVLREKKPTLQEEVTSSGLTGFHENIAHSPLVNNHHEGRCFP